MEGHLDVLGGAGPLLEADDVPEPRVGDPLELFAVVRVVEHDDGRHEAVVEAGGRNVPEHEALLEAGHAVDDVGVDEKLRRRGF